MSINKILLISSSASVLTDLTNDTVMPEYVSSGITFHDHTGALCVGTCDCVDYPQSGTFELEKADVTYNVASYANAVIPSAKIWMAKPDNIRYGATVFGVAGALTDERRTAELSQLTQWAVSNHQSTDFCSAFASCFSIVDQSLNDQNGDICAVPRNQFLSNLNLYHVNLPNCLKIGSHAFASCSNLIDAHLPQVVDIENWAFDSCTSLSTVQLPACHSVQGAVFMGCSNLASVYLPECESLGDGVFRQCTSLVSISLPKCQYIDNHCMDMCSSLTSISLPVCQYIGAYAFCSTALSSIILPMCSSADHNFYKGMMSEAYVEFAGITSVTYGMFATIYAGTSTVSETIHLGLPNCLSIGQSGFYCTRFIKSLSLPVCTFIGDGAFYGDGKISALYCPNVTSISGSPFGNMATLKSIDFPKLSLIPSWNGIGATSLDFVNLPALKVFSHGALNAFYNAKTLVLRDASIITDARFTGDSAMQSFYVLGYSLLSVQSYSSEFLKNATNTTVYVRASLLSTFKSASGWTNVSSRIIGLTDEEIAALNFHE